MGLMPSPSVWNTSQSGTDPALAGRVTLLENIRIRTARFASIGSGTSGTVTLPASSVVVLDDFGGTVDAVVTTISGGRPTYTHAYDASGNIVTTTFDSSGNYVLSGVPASGYPVAIIYRVYQLQKDFDSTSSDIVGGPEVVSLNDGFLTSAHIYVGNASNVATDVAMSGVIAISNTGATSYAAVPANTAVANFTGGSAVPTNTALSATGGTSNFVMRSSGGNSTANNFTTGWVSTVSSVSTIVLTAASARQQYFSGTVIQNYNLPDATTLINGWKFEFKNNTSMVGSIRNNAGTNLTTIQPGEKIIFTCTSIASSNGTWNTEKPIPSNAIWGTAGLSLTGTLTVSSSGTFIGAISASNFSGSSSGTNTGDQLTFKTVVPISGTSAVATTGTDTLTFSSPQVTVSIAGAATNQIQFHVPGALVHPNVGSTFEYANKSADNPQYMTGIGVGALSATTGGTAVQCSAFGSGTLGTFATGSSVDAFGAFTLYQLVSGTAITAFGTQAGQSLGTGDAITLFGTVAGAGLSSNANGSLFVGAYAGQSLGDNSGQHMGVGSYALTTLYDGGTSGNLAIGPNCLYSLEYGSYNLIIAANGFTNVYGGASYNTIVGQNFSSAVTDAFNFNTVFGQNNFPSITDNGNFFTHVGTLSYGALTASDGSITSLGYGILPNATFVASATIIGYSCAPNCTDFEQSINIGDGGFPDAEFVQYNINLGNFGGGTLIDGTYCMSFGHYSRHSQSDIQHEVVFGGSTADLYYFNRFWFGNGGLPDPNPQDVTFSPTDRSGTNAAGANYILQSGMGVGNQLSGELQFWTGPAGASGSTGTTATKAVSIDGNGNLRAYRLHNNITAQGSSSNQDIRSGTYTPTLTNTANISSSTAFKSQWTRVGNVVTVSGKVNITGTLTLTSTTLGISLPIASNLAAEEDLAGTAFCPTVAGNGAALLADATNDRASLKFVVTGVAADSYFYTFSYEVK